jgi:hypothetical protein
MFAGGVSLLLTTHCSITVSLDAFDALILHMHACVTMLAAKCGDVKALDPSQRWIHQGSGPSKALDLCVMLAYVTWVTVLSCHPPPWDWHVCSCLARCAN